MFMVYLLISLISSKRVVAAEQNFNGDQFLKIQELNKLCSTSDADQAHFSQCELYFRCENGTRLETRCSDGLLFDVRLSTCVPGPLALCANESLVTQPCFGQSDGLYPYYGADCAKYVKCEYGKVIEVLDCPHGLQFNYQKQSCLPKKEVSCIPSLCNSEADGVFWTPGTSCQSYYHCLADIPLQISCPTGYRFSKFSNTCVQNGECYEPICTGREDGLYQDSTHSCKRVLHCKGGNLVKLTHCPNGKTFNGTHCSEDLGQCQNPISTSIVIDSLQDDCLGYSDGFHVIPDTFCRRYQQCKKNKVILKSECPINYHFNGANCIENFENFQCENMCEGRPNGYFADISENCRKYYFCQNQRLLRRFSCPEGTLYGGTMCLPLSLVKCPETSKTNSNTCLGLSDGFHADYQNDCRDYFLCSNNLVKFRNKCLVGTWDGFRCDPNRPLCFHVKNSDCHGLKTGLFLNYTSNFQNYFYCNNGYKTNLLCPWGKVFDGNYCVDNGQFPTYDFESCFNKTNGYHTLPNCKSYYLCLDNRKTTYVCSNGLLFNGTQCVPNEYYACPILNNDCDNLNNGYYPDFNFNCHRYFYCDNNVKLISLTCDIGKVFDGVKCVAGKSCFY